MPTPRYTMVYFEMIITEVIFTCTTLLNISFTIIFKTAFTTFHYYERIVLFNYTGDHLYQKGYYLHGSDIYSTNVHNEGIVF